MKLWDVLLYLFIQHFVMCKLKWYFFRFFENNKVILKVTLCNYGHNICCHIRKVWKRVWFLKYIFFENSFYDNFWYIGNGKVCTICCLFLEEDKLFSFLGNEIQCNHFQKLTTLFSRSIRIR